MEPSGVGLFLPACCLRGAQPRGFTTRCFILFSPFYGAPERRRNSRPEGSGPSSYGFRLLLKIWPHRQRQSSAMDGDPR